MSNFTLNLPEGEIFKNNTSRENSIAFTDNTDKEEIVKYFRRYEDAKTLIYIKGNKIKIYDREHWL